MRALLDTGPLPNILSADLCRNLHLVPKPTTRHIKVADGKASQVLWEMKAVPTPFAKKNVPFSYLVLTDAPFELIVRASVIEALGPETDLRRQMVTLSLHDCSIRASLPLLNDGVDKLWYGSAESTTVPAEADECEQSEADEESEVAVASEEGEWVGIVEDSGRRNFLIPIRKEDEQIRAGKEASAEQMLDMVKWFEIRMNSNSFMSPDRWGTCRRGCSHGWLRCC